MANCPAPAFMKLYYTVASRPHRMLLCFLPGSTGKVIKRDTTQETWSDAIVALLAVLTPLYRTDSNFSGWEVYTQADCVSVPIFVGSGDLVGINGSVSTGTVLRNYTQDDFTFRTQNGGRFKLRLMEDNNGRVNAADNKVALASVGSPFSALRDFLVGNSGWVVGYDGSYPNFPLNIVQKTNDALRKKYINP